MSSNPNEDVLTTHTYDGIQEYDNPMPGWWSFIFITNIVWAVVYVVGMSMDFLPDYQDDLRAEMVIQQRIEEANRAALPPVTPEMLAEAAADGGVVALGAEVYAMNCATCHGSRGEGLIGPNLTDDAWLRGDDTMASLHEAIAGGTPNGMPAWGPILLQEELVAVTAFTKSLQGTNPPNPKAPEGEPPSSPDESNPEDG